MRSDVVGWLVDQWWWDLRVRVRFRVDMDVVLLTSAEGNACECNERRPHHRI